MYKSGGLKKSIKASRKMKKGGANNIQEIIGVDSLPQNIQPQAAKLNGLISDYNNVKDTPGENVTALLKIANQIVEILTILAPSKQGFLGSIFSRRSNRVAPVVPVTPAAAPVVPVTPAAAPVVPVVPVTPAAAEEAAAEEVAAEEAAAEEAAAEEVAAEEAGAKALINEQQKELREAQLAAAEAATAVQNNPDVVAAGTALTNAQERVRIAQLALDAVSAQDGGRKKKAATRKVKRGGAIDMSKLYNVSGLIVDSKDPVAMAAQVGQDNTPMPFSSSGQGITYSAGIPEQFMRDLNPTLGMAGGKKRTAGSAKTHDKQRAGSAKTKTQDKKRKDSAKTKSKK